MNLVEKLGIRGELFVFEMMCFHAAATQAKQMGMTALDPDIIKQEALKHDKICGDSFMSFLNKKQA